MAGMNGKFHLTLPTEDLIRLRNEAEEFEISVAELMRRKLANPPTDEEIMQLRKMKILFKNKQGERLEENEI
jgi:hypothetical protein